MCVIAFSFIACNYYENRIRPLDINGVVIDKYRAKNRDYPLMIIDNQGIEMMLTLYDYEKSGLWNYVQVDDSIYKNKGELIFFVSRDGKRKRFLISQ